MRNNQNKKRSTNMKKLILILSAILLPMKSFATLTEPCKSAIQNPASNDIVIEKVYECPDKFGNVNSEYVHYLCFDIKNNSQQFKSFKIRFKYFDKDGVKIVEESFNESGDDGIIEPNSTIKLFVNLEVSSVEFMDTYLKHRVDTCTYNMEETTISNPLFIYTYNDSGYKQKYSNNSKINVAKAYIEEKNNNSYFNLILQNDDNKTRYIKDIDFCYKNGVRIMFDRWRNPKSIDPQEKERFLAIFSPFDLHGRVIEDYCEKYIME